MRAERWALLAALWAGCRATPYRCDPTHACGPTAVCSAQGYCAERVAAATCPSGLRFTQSAAEPGACVAATDAQTPTDATIDAVADVAVDAPADTAPSADVQDAVVVMDATPDAAPDAVIDAATDATRDAATDAAPDAATDATSDAAEDARGDASDAADVPPDPPPCTEVARAIRPLSGSRMSGTHVQVALRTAAAGAVVEVSPTQTFVDAPSSFPVRGVASRFEGSTSTLDRGTYFWHVRARCSDGGLGPWSPTWSFHLAGHPDGQGRVIGWVHDLNGDGRGDLAVGVPTRGASDLEGSKVEVFPSDPTHELTRGAAYWTVTPASSTPLFGDTVAIVPDMNGDGLAELAVGACEFDPGKVCTPVVAVFRGARDPATPLVLLGEIRSPEEGLMQRFGVTLAGVGDVTGDGYGDLAIGDPGLFGRGVGRLHLVPGGATGFGAASQLARLDDIPDAGHGMTLFGRQVAGPGDVTGDGLPDIVVTSFQQAWVIPGGAIADIATVRTDPVELYADTEGTYGFRASGAGDFNGDGLADFALSRPGQRSNMGDVSVFLGTNPNLTTADPAECMESGESRGI